jgi:glycogen debranching enzyme
MSVAKLNAEDECLIEECRLRSIALLKSNLGPAGILAAHPTAAAQERGYAAIFARDAAVCALGMAVSGDDVLRAAAGTAFETLAQHQAPNGQFPKFVDLTRNEPDFWYLGCIDATLWWLLGIGFLDAEQRESRLRRRFAGQTRRALAWLQAQEHQRFRLLQQNEASDWADIMPRSGFVLYTNALWYRVKRIYRLAHAGETYENFNQLFHPFSTDLGEYRRARLLAHYARNKARNRDLYLPFVNFSFFGDEGDVFGNLLAILLGLCDEDASHRTVLALERAQVDEPYPVRVVCEPIRQESMLWRPYMSRHRQNFAWQYHNGGIWPFVGAFWVIVLAAMGRQAQARAGLARVARANAQAGWRFSEWFHGQSLAPSGMAGQSWNAAAYLLATHALARRPEELQRMFGMWAAARERD